jgi:prephenate dehydratase
MAVLAYLGPEGTFTHQAALDVAAPEDELLALRTAPDVVRAVEDGTAAAGVVAFENSLQGPVSENLDEILAGRRCLLAGERVLAVSFALFRAPGDDTPLVGVASHPFGLLQCSRFVTDRRLETRESTSTAAACRELAADPRTGWGAIAPRIAGERLGLAIEADGIENAERAETRFVVLRPTCPPPSGRDRTAFVFQPRSDEPGSLVRLLQEFSVRQINLTAIKSRPAKLSLGEYVFFIECEGHIADPVLRDAVLGLLRFDGEVRFLGSYAEDPERPPRTRAGRDADDRIEAYEAMLQRVADLPVRG